jgi:hypothetical protein
MSVHRRSLLGLVALSLALAAGRADAEAFWSTNYGKLLAFEVDFQGGAAQYTMQATGDASGIFNYFGVAREPGTGTLWVVYNDLSQYRLALGRLQPGTSRPQEVALLDPTYEHARNPKFASNGTLYLVLVGTYPDRTILASMNTATGHAEPILTFTSPSFLAGLGFDSISGKLYLSGTEDCTPACTWFLDTLTVPQHQRERLLDFTSYIDGEPLFSSAGEMLVVDGNLYQSNGATLVYFSGAPQVSTPFGPFFASLFEGSPAEGTLGCVPSPNRACLQNRRFAVEATYDATSYGGSTGVAKPQLESDESIKFSFFAPANLEVFAKVIDGCGYNGHYWIFASGLTNLGVALRVTDTTTGEAYEIDNPSGQTFAPVLDIQAFACSQ